jgi:hypothetical protein
MTRVIGDLRWCITYYYFSLLSFPGLSVNEEVLSQDNTLLIVNSRTNAPMYVRADLVVRCSDQ